MLPISGEGKQAWIDDGAASKYGGLYGWSRCPLMAGPTRMLNIVGSLGCTDTPATTAFSNYFSYMQSDHINGHVYV